MNNTIKSQLNLINNLPCRIIYIWSVLMNKYNILSDKNLKHIFKDFIY